MPGIRVRTPSGESWTVRRRWIPHRDGIGLRARTTKLRRGRERRGDDERARWYDGLHVPNLDLDAIAVVIVAVLAILFVILLGWPLVLLGIDLAWLTLVLIAGAIGRTLLGRPWRVDAVSGDDRRQWYVQGFRAAGRLRDHVADQFRHGQNPTPERPEQLPH